MANSLAKKRLIAFKKQSGHCYYCKAPTWLSSKEGFANQYRITESDASRLQCTAEHLIARCEGGSNDSDNIVAACLFCNTKRHQRKKSYSPDKYREFIQRRLAKGKWHPESLLRLIAQHA